MAILTFTMHILSAAMLLLFAVRLMRLGIERLWSQQIRESLNENSSLPGLVLKGSMLGFVMQGATVVMLMAAGLSGSGTIGFTAAAIIGLGADFGSALAVIFLNLPISALGPLLVLVGGWIYLRSVQPRLRNYGRVFLGLGLILLSLSLIRTAVAPLSGLSEVQALMHYLNSDPITAALVGMALTLLMHSSVAAILTAVAYASSGDFGPVAGLAYILGCNLGSALLPVWLLRGEDYREQVAAKTVAILRWSLALPCIIALAIFGQSYAVFISYGSAEIMLVGHAVFNATLLLLAPFGGRIAKFISHAGAEPHEPQTFRLANGLANNTSLVLPILKRQLGVMLELLSSMLEACVSSAPVPATVSALEARMNTALSDLRKTYAALPDMDSELDKDVRQLIEFAIRVERCGDVFAGRYLKLRSEEVSGVFQLSDEGREEVDALADQVREALILAQEVVWAERAEAARHLVEHKQKVALLESRSRERHLRRVRSGNLTSLASSDQHLDMIAALKEVNSKLATIGYAVLDKHGELKKSRLKALKS